LYIVRQGCDQRADRDALHGEPRRSRQGTDVVDRADQCQQCRCRSHDQELTGLVLQQAGRQGNPGGEEDREDDCNAAALRRRLVMRRAGARLHHHIAGKPWPQQQDKRPADEEGENNRPEDPETLGSLLDHRRLFRPPDHPHDSIAAKFAH